MNANLKVRCSYWLENALVKNLGDYLGILVLEAMGYRAVGRNDSASDVVNPGRCLLPIGSVLSEETFEGITEPVDIWGCGWRGAVLSPAVMARVRFYAVRGPRTAAGLGLPETIPLGDPALLLPHLRKRTIKHHGRTLVVPHFFRVAQIHASQRCRLTGCDELLATWILGVPLSGQRVSLQRLRRMIRSWLQLDIPVRTAWQAIDRIAGADFVLTSSLHGAMLAQAYGAPWAAYDDGVVRLPEKWHDWADYLGIRMAFVPDLKAGRAWWNAEGRHGTIRKTRTLLEAFPYPQKPG